MKFVPSKMSIIILPLGIKKMYFSIKIWEYNKFVTEVFFLFTLIIVQDNE